MKFDSFEAGDAAIEAMNGQYLADRQIVVQYAFKQDSPGERHGTEAERALAKSRSRTGAQRLKPHTRFAASPGEITSVNNTQPMVGQNTAPAAPKYAPPPVPQGYQPPPMPANAVPSGNFGGFYGAPPQQPPPPPPPMPQQWQQQQPPQQQFYGGMPQQMGYGGMPNYNSNVPAMHQPPPPPPPPPSNPNS